MSRNDKNFWQEQASLPQKQNMAEYQEQYEHIGHEQNMHEQIQADLKYLLNLPEGRRFLQMIFAETRVFEALPVGNYDVYAYYEGKRSIGLMLYHRVQALGLQYLNILQGE